jgi:hypothetical protein
LGVASLPERMSDLKAHFNNRLQDATSDWQVAVVKAAIKSCDDFLSWCQRKAQRANADLATAQAKGWPWTPGPEADIAFFQTGIARRDSVQQSQANQLDKVADVLSVLAQSAINQQRGGVTPAPEGISPEDYAQYLKFKQFQAEQERARQEANSAPPQTEVILEGELSPVETPKCAGATKSGNPCTGKATENGYCGLHQSQATSE